MKRRIHMTKETRMAYRSGYLRQFSKIISILVVFILVTASSVSFAQSETEDVTDATERRLKVSDYRQKMMAGWIGQMVGVGWGAPTEFRYANKIIPADEVPEWKPEMVNVWEQDDLYVEMTFMRSLEEYGLDVSVHQAGIDFANSEYALWHANEAGRDNLRKGIAPPDSSHPQFNSHADDIDYQIEADFSGLISPGLPNSVIALGEKFGRLMNYGDGVYGGQFVGCMYAEAFFEDDPAKLVDAGLKCIPEDSQYAEMVRDVVRWYEDNPDDWIATWQLVNKKYHEDPDYIQCLCTRKGGDFNIDAKINGAYIVMGMLYGGGDFDQTMVISMRAGQDSDCNPSNAGGVLFTTSNFDSLDSKYISALEQGVKFSYTEYDFQGLADVSMKLAREIVVQAGGRIEKDEDGEEVFVIPVQDPEPSKLEKSWDPGPIAGTTFSNEEFPHLRWMGIASALVWIILALALVLPRENRNRNALWMIAAVAVAFVVWELIKHFGSHQYLAMNEATRISHVLGLAVIFLLGDRLAKLKWPALFGTAFFIIVAMGFVGMLGMESIYFEGVDLSLTARIAGAAVVIVLAAAMTSRQCRKDVSKTRFLLRLFMWVFLIQLLVSMVAVGVMYGIGTMFEYWYWWLLMVTAFTLANYLMTLPLWILALTNSLYRQRLESCLKLKDN